RGAPPRPRQAVDLSGGPACRRDRDRRGVCRAAAVAAAGRSWRRGALHPRSFWAWLMAQLSDDCFAFGGALLGVDAALALIRERIVPVVAEESVPLAAASGRILARDLVAEIDVPPYANSAVDGYAILHADLLPDRETVLPVT